MQMLRTLIDDLGGSARAARIIAVHPGTVRRWLRGAVMIPTASYRALYAASQWGKSERHVYAITDRANHLALIDAQRREILALRLELARLARIGDFGAANDPGQQIGAL